MRRLSMSPRQIPEVKAWLREAAVTDLGEMAARCLEHSTAAEVQESSWTPSSNARALAGERSGPERYLKKDLRRGSSMRFPIRRVDKPWGYELIFAHTDRYVGKILHVNAGHALSLQYHEVKDETLYLADGEVELVVEEDGALVSTRPAGRRLLPHQARDEVTAWSRARTDATSSRSPPRSSTTW